MAPRPLEASLISLAGRLRPDPERAAEASARAVKHIQQLNDNARASWVKVIDWVAHGSHARDTAIAGFKDVDYMVVLDETALRTTTGQERSAADTVQRMASIIRQRRAGLVSQGVIQVRTQDHSVGIKYPASEYRVDLVPARKQGRGVYLIPERSSGEWIEARPNQLSNALNKAEEQHRHVRPAIRLLKSWRRARGKAMRISSYALELLVIEQADKAPKTLTGLLQAVLTPIAEAKASARLVLAGRGDGKPITIYDPSTRLNVTAELTRDHRTRLVSNARTAVEQLATMRAGSVSESALERLFLGSWAEYV